MSKSYDEYSSNRSCCDACVGGKFSNCIKNKCIHGSTAKSVVGAMEATYWNMRGTYKYIDKIICPSEFMKEQMDKNPLFAGKTVAQHNFVEHVENGEKSGDRTGADGVVLSDGTKLPPNYVLYFGRYSLEKGIRTMIEACNMLPEVDFVFAGKGDYADEIKGLQYATEVGFRTGADLDLLISNAMFTVYPSEWYENNPFSVMESQERLVPVVGADIGGIPELIRNGMDGMLFESGNAVHLADVIKYLWDNPETVAEFKGNLVEVVNKRKDLSEYTEWIEKIYV